MPPAPPEEDERLYQRIFGRFAATIENASEEDIAAVEAGRKALGLDGVQPTPGLLDFDISARIELPRKLLRRLHSFIRHRSS